ncbi:hypothetical protein HETIRDRAFT_168592 [Heterobasidion irregulare TC 32-1]|uniref:Uncharacterized protein n=1 Tax=Heterobasidion irregulare (strain TC 32-1) TaxID=747525 RepID=W4KJ91_HETIT|nr:uncharacterized protein HETIRDRAFT_168592 [Heterobasidion irregulare TC 32-1]ETW85136.1 hypothetical protein HETIRDRAFT_168592 [Heterobasidion irregulare TC 32-1]
MVSIWLFCTAPHHHSRVARNTRIFTFGRLGASASAIVDVRPTQLPNAQEQKQEQSAETASIPADITHDNNNDTTRGPPAPRKRDAAAPSQPANAAAAPLRRCSAHYLSTSASRLRRHGVVSEHDRGGARTRTRGSPARAPRRGSALKARISRENVSKWIQCAENIGCGWRVGQ